MSIVEENGMYAYNSEDDCNNLKEDDVEVYDNIGRGTFGEVFRGSLKAKGLACVLKRIDLAGLSTQACSHAYNEVTILAQLRHPFIIRYYGVFIDCKQRLTIVMEFADRETLHHLLHQTSEDLSEDIVWSIFIQLTLALLYVHQKHILHRDIKAANVFLTSSSNMSNTMTVKLGDFGVAKQVSNTGSELQHTIIGTPAYLSPEVFLEQPYGDRSDIWALGVLLYEMCSRRQPFEAESQGALMFKIIQGDYEPLGDMVSHDFHFICACCLRSEPMSRPNALELATMPEFTAKAQELEIDIPPMVFAAAYPRPPPKGPLELAQPPPRRSRVSDRAAEHSEACAGPTAALALPAFKRGVLEARHPGGHIPSRRVRARPPAPLDTPRPALPALVSAPRAPRGATTRPAPPRASEASRTGMKKICSTTRPGFNLPPVSKEPKQITRPRPCWDREARFQPINLNDTSAGHAKGASPRVPRICRWVRPDSTLRLPAVPGTLLLMDRVENEESDDLDSSSPSNCNANSICEEMASCFESPDTSPSSSSSEIVHADQCSSQVVFHS